MGRHQLRKCESTVGEENGMKIARRIAIALGSLLAVALAGGAHWRG